MPHTISLKDLHAFSVLMPHLQAFEVVFGEVLDVEIDDPDFFNAHQSFHDSLRREIEVLRSQLTEGMVLEIKKVALGCDPPSAPSRSTQTDWYWTFKRK